MSTFFLWNTFSFFLLSVYLSDSEREQSLNYFRSMFQSAWVLFVKISPPEFPVKKKNWRKKIRICLKTVHQQLPKHQANRARRNFCLKIDMNFNNNASLIICFLILVLTLSRGYLFTKQLHFFFFSPVGRHGLVRFWPFKFFSFQKLHQCSFVCHWKIPTATENWPVQGWYKDLSLSLSVSLSLSLSLSLSIVRVCSVNIHDACFNLHFATLNIMTLYSLMMTPYNFQVKVMLTPYIIQL